MKVFNLTDVETPELVRSRLVGHSFAVGSALLAPGASQEVSEEQLRSVRANFQSLLDVGALFLGAAPPARYTLLKEQAKESSKKGGSAPEKKGEG